MTGEMSWINQNGKDSNGDEWPLHAAIARELGGEIKPFDVYRGPYVVFGGDVRVGSSLYAIAPTGLGVVRLWLYGEEGVLYWYREDTDQESGRFLWDDELAAVEEARALLANVLQTYKVVWTIELDAISPRNAARHALAIHRESGSTATVFEVTDPEGNATLIDLEEEEGE